MEKPVAEHLQEKHLREGCDDHFQLFRVDGIGRDIVYRGGVDPAGGHHPTAGTGPVYVRYLKIRLFREIFA